MNLAERRRDLRIAAMLDLELLDLVCNDGEVEADEFVIACNMRTQVRAGERAHLSLKQRAWAEDIACRITPFSSKDVPEGRPVATPDVLKDLPKRPPRRVVDV